MTSDPDLYGHAARRTTSNHPVRPYAGAAWKPSPLCLPGLLVDLGLGRLVVLSTFMRRRLLLLPISCPSTPGWDRGGIHWLLFVMAGSPWTFHFLLHFPLPFLVLLLPGLPTKVWMYGCTLRTHRDPRGRGGGAFRGSYLNTY